VSDYLTGASIPEISRAKAVLDDPAVAATPELPAHFQDRVVHRRDGWTFAIAMSSKRMARYEWGNGENLRGWYVGDGMTYLYKDDHAQFYDAFWPTVDAQRLPGTTVSTRPRQPHGTGGGTGTIAAYAEWVGGAPYRETAGAVGMHLINHVKSLQARKSWFCLSDSVVALGAGISGRLPGRDGGREPEPARGRGSGPAGRRSQSTDEPGLDRLVRRAKLGAPRGSGRVPVPPATPISSASSSTGPWA
jgi:hyaluronate lyase